MAVFMGITCDKCVICIKFEGTDHAPKLTQTACTLIHAHTMLRAACFSTYVSTSLPLS